MIGFSELRNDRPTSSAPIIQQPRFSLLPHTNTSGAACAHRPYSPAPAVFPEPNNTPAASQLPGVAAQRSEPIPARRELPTNRPEVVCQSVSVLLSFCSHSHQSNIVHSPHQPSIIPQTSHLPLQDQYKRECLELEGEVSIYSDLLLHYWMTIHPLTVLRVSPYPSSPIVRGSNNATLPLCSLPTLSYFAQSITFDPRSGLMDVNKWAFLDQADLHPTRMLCRNSSTW